jgi:YVTN family beta-propeller protein
MKKITFIFIIFLGIIIFLGSGCKFLKNKEKVASYTEPALSMPYNKIITPAGKLIFFGDSSLENHALDVAISPDKRVLAVEERYSVVFINIKNNKVIYVLIPRKDRKFRIHGQNTYSGISWYREGDKQMLLWGSKNSLIKAEWNGKKAWIVDVYKFRPKKDVRASIPNEVLVRKENNEYYAYVVLNGNDEVAKINLKTGNIVWQKPVGLAPYGICFANGKLYISNWSGYVPDSTDTEVAGIPWERASVDKFGIVNSGTVSVLNPQNGEQIKEIPVGLHPNDIISSPDQNFVYVANGNDDNVSVISTKTDSPVETISVRLNKQKNPYFGDSPNGLAISTDAKTLYVSNGMDNAVAVIRLGRKSSLTAKKNISKLEGFIPTAAYPAGIALLNDTLMYVADIEAIGARLTVKDTTNRAFQTFFFPPSKRHSTAGAFNSHRMIAAISVIPLPNKKVLKQYTEQVVKNNNQQRLSMLDLLPRKGVKPVPVPKRIGEPSVFKHVVYIIKENRTYDQVLGDVKKGNGDSSLCIFGRKITPNIHKLVNDYVLLDNYKASGKCSSEGHLWTDASIVTDYIEKNVRAWFRSYTHVLYDAMAYPKTGFLWDNALDHGKTVRIYGETAVPIWHDGETWADIYNNFLEGKKFKFTNKTTIKRVRPILSSTYPGYDSHNIPDVLRAKAFIDELHNYEHLKGDSLPNLIIIALPNDHTAVTAPKHPTPRAMVADNDYALGQIIDAISHSKFWKNTVIFITEDDSQNGWDHVSAYRTVGMVVSPYTHTGKVISTDYNQTSLIRTIEQILGLPPMNIEDATASPMFDVFDTVANMQAYTAIKNKIPLDEMNPDIKKLHGKKKKYAMLSSQIVKKGIDAADDDDLLNRIIWNACKPGKKYPSKYVTITKDRD